MPKSMFFLMVTVMTTLSHTTNKRCIIASWNILSETFYQKFSAPAPFSRMPLHERSILFKNFISAMTISVDIFALQECGSLEFPEILKEEYTLAGGIDGYLVTAIKNSRYSLLKTEAFKSCGRGHGKGFLVVLAQTFDTQKITFGVINTHLPFVRQSDDNNAQLHDLRAIRSYMKDHPTIKYWFVCGDFNIPATKADTIEAALNSQHIMPNTRLESFAYTLPTAFGHKGLEHIDYIFYTPATITALDYTTIPSAQNAASTLLTQGLCSSILTDAGRGHASDHAMSVMTCFFKT